MTNVDFVRRVQCGDAEPSLRLETDIPLIAEAAKDNGYGLIVLDPILRVAGQLKDSHNASQLRQALDPVEELAKETGAAILGITHLRKQTAAGGRGPVLDSILGSGAWSQVARVVWFAFKAQDMESEFHAGDYEYCLGLAASNLGIDKALIPYDITVDDKDVTAIDFGTEQAVSATDALEARTPGAREQAAAWIRRNVPPGEEILSTTIQAQVEAAGLSWRTVQNAKSDCLVRSLQRGGQWYWYRPE